jgi:hypothetical protein
LSGLTDIAATQQRHLRLSVDGRVSPAKTDVGVMAFGLPEVVAAPSAKLDSAEGPTQFEFVNAKSDTEVCMVPPGQKCRDNR